MGLASSLATPAPFGLPDTFGFTPPPAATRSPFAEVAPAWGPDAPPNSPRYRPVRILGRGGSATVWRVHDEVLSRDVAMKVLHASAGVAEADGEAELLREARLTGGLGVAGIVAVHDAGRLPDGRAYFTMQCVDGPTLADAIDARQGGAYDALGLRTLVGVLARVARTLSQVHARGVAHRDVKPANVLIGPAGEAFLADWGLAGRATAVSADTEVLSGTLHYMAPEHLDGAGRHLGPVSDVYALGVCLYEVLTGSTPHHSATAVGLVYQIRTVDAPDPRTVAPGAGIPAALAALCRDALVRDPARRSVTARTFADRLEAF
jgi:serine/threonine protein kinase